MTGLKIFKGVKGDKNKKIEVSMIDINMQQEKELMRQSIITKKSGGDVTTLAGNSQAFMMTNSPMRAFNTKIGHKKSPK